MDELDLLKKDWKKTNTIFKEVSELELYRMLHKSSSSIVQWILIFSIGEIILWTAISFYSSTDDYLKSINHPELEIYFDAISIFNYVISIGFIYFFYKKYRQISTVSSTKKLMNSILRTRKIVRLYVKYNLFMIVFGMLLGIFTAFTYNPAIVGMKEKMQSESSMMAGVIVGVVIMTSIIVGLFWLFYRLVYGRLTRKLHSNYKELKRIEM